LKKLSTAPITICFKHQILLASINKSSVSYVYFEVLFLGELIFSVMKLKLKKSWFWLRVGQFILKEINLVTDLSLNKRQTKRES